jgi:hypothetical protein
VINFFQNKLFFKNKLRMKTFNILIATIGRPTLLRLLASLRGQMTSDDCVTVVFDGVKSTLLSPEFIESFPCRLIVFEEPQQLGAFGHGVRNKYAGLLERRDFVMHADDDDMYNIGAFSELRQLCTDPSTLYLAQFINCASKIKIPRDGSTVIRHGHIGTPCGIIPYDLNSKGEWAMKNGGDGEFYEALSKSALGSVVFLNRVIYWVRPEASTRIIPEQRDFPIETLCLSSSTSESELIEVILQCIETKKRHLFLEPSCVSALRLDLAHVTKTLESQLTLLDEMPRLTIVKADYGNKQSGKMIDVTQTVAQFLDSPIIDMNTVFGDPAFGLRKSLYLEYKLLDTYHVVVVDESEKSLLIRHPFVRQTTRSKSQSNHSQEPIRSLLASFIRKTLFPQDQPNDKKDK